MSKSSVSNSEQNEPVARAPRVVLPFPRMSGRAEELHNDAMAARLREVFRQHRAGLVRFLRARLGTEADAQDVAQDAIFRLYQRRTTLDDKDLRALLYVTARNIATDRLRERRRSPVSFDIDATVAIEQLIDEAASPERILLGKERVALLRALLKELPPKCEQAFVNYKFDGLEYAEIAARMAVSESMVRKYVLRALAHCAARFAGLEGTR
jgi:RNA polymerase sigma-70 factor (ECF subfamily)